MGGKLEFTSRLILETNTFQNKNKRRKKNVTFNEEEIIINPEDVDPSVGRFRNLIQSVIVQPSASSKRPKLDLLPIPETPPKSFISPQPYAVPALSLYQGISEPVHDKSVKSVETDMLNPLSSFGSKFMILPNPAPEVSSEIIGTSSTTNGKSQNVKKTGFGAFFFLVPTKEEAPRSESSDEPKKKKYAKEAWPGRKPLMGV